MLKAKIISKLNVFCLLGCIHAGGLIAGNPVSEKGKVKDTVQAVVIYGDDYLLKKIQNPDPDLISWTIDSLLCLDKVPQSLVEQLTLYAELSQKSRDEIVQMIDSLFTLDSIPYPLINQINLYVATNPKEHINVSLPWYYDENSKYPADTFYHDWNTNFPNPYGTDLSQQDTVVKLVLENDGLFGYYTPPVIGPITSRFGWRDGRNHCGMDIDLEVWDTVKAAFPGMIRVARWYEGYGRVVVIRHWNGLETVYAHLHRIKVKPGDMVESGAFIGYGGSSGHSTGSHLHFECRFKGIPLNPSSFISFEQNRLLNDTLILRKMQWNYASYPEGSKFYTVHRGDFLYKIANQFGITVKKLRDLNGLNQHSIISVGQKLRVI